MELWGCRLEGRGDGGGAVQWVLGEGVLGRRAPDEVGGNAARRSGRAGGGIVTSSGRLRGKSPRQDDLSGRGVRGLCPSGTQDVARTMGFTNTNTTTTTNTTGGVDVGAHVGLRRAAARAVGVG